MSVITYYLEGIEVIAEHQVTNHPMIVWSGRDRAHAERLARALVAEDWRQLRLTWEEAGKPQEKRLC